MFHSDHKWLKFLGYMLILFTLGPMFMAGACITVPKKAAVVEAPTSRPYVAVAIPAEASADVKAGVQLGGKQVHAGGDVTINEGIPWKWVLAVLGAWHIPNPKYRKFFSKRREPLRTALV